MPNIKKKSYTQRKQEHKEFMKIKREKKYSSHNTSDDIIHNRPSVSHTNETIINTKKNAQRGFPKIP